MTFSDAELEATCEYFHPRRDYYKVDVIERKKMRRLLARLAAAEAVCEAAEKEFQVWGDTGEDDFKMGDALATWKEARGTTTR